MATLDKLNAEKKGGKKSAPKDNDMSNAVARTEKIRDWTEHVIEIEKLAEDLQTIIKKKPEDVNYFGLTDELAAKKLRGFGPNALTEKKGLPWYLKFLLCLTGLFNYLLWAGSILCFIAYGVQKDKRDKSNLYLGIVLALVVILTAIFAYYQ